MPSGTTLLAIVVGFLAAVVGAIYVFGIPNEWKKVMEEKALETMGENKASYMMKGVSNLDRQQLPVSAHEC